MWLTAQNAKEYIGKKLDKKGRKGRSIHESRKRGTEKC